VSKQGQDYTSTKRRTSDTDELNMSRLAATIRINGKYGRGEGVTNTFSMRRTVPKSGVDVLIDDVCGESTLFSLLLMMV